MKLTHGAVLLVLGLAAASCRVIPEEFNPAGPNPTGSPTAAPTTSKTPRPRSTPAGTPSGTPAATPTPSPTRQAGPTRTPKPTATPTLPDGCPIWPGNCKPTDHVGAVVFYVSCPEGVVPNSKYAKRGRVGCNVRFDCNARDAENQVTWPKGTPRWTFSDGSFPVDYPNQNPFTPQVHGTKKGSFTAYVTIDGKKSDVLRFEFVQK